MTVKQLIQELSQYPLDWEVWMQVQGREGLTKDVIMESGGVSTWLTVIDYRDNDPQN